MGVSGLADTSEETMHSSFVTRLHRMRLGPYAMERPITTCGSTHNFNLFGAEVLRRFHVVFDYERKRMILEPNASFKDPIRQDTSGMMIVATAEDVNVRRVQFVTPGSPAADAKLQAGDMLIRIDGKPAASRSLQATRELFYIAGEEHAIEIKRGAEIHSIVLRTRDLF